MQLDALDIIGELLTRCSPVAALVAQHEQIMHALVAQLAPPPPHSASGSAAASGSGSVRLAVRKRAIVTLGALVASCAGALLSSLYERLLAELSSERAPALQVCCYCHCYPYPLSC